MKKIYFLCTGNSCRSQMAEGYGHQLLPLDKFEVRSAGVEVHGLNPRAVTVMKEDGVDISQHVSQLIDEKYFNEADFIITLCGDAKDRCPVIPNTATHLHWGLLDPAKATGTEIEIQQAFRDVRDEIKKRIYSLLNE